MLDMIQNDDELALVIGHEVSHLILGHVSQRNLAETVLRTVEVLILSLDPTEGVLTLAVVGGLATLRNALTAAFSRDHEREADELGMKLAAMACFDTQRAAAVFRRLHENEKLPKPSKFLSFVDSHPPSEERYRDLVLASESENANSYPNRCAAVQKKMQSVWA
jgi:Zn-dependent protease with chaperone function